MIARPSTCGIAVAKMGTQDITEIGVPAPVTLDDDVDTHFGLNSENFNKKVDRKFWGLGARTLDIVNRGGRTAENTWRWLNHGSIPLYCSKKSCREPVTFARGAMILHVRRSGRFYAKLHPHNLDVTSVTRDKGQATRRNCPHCWFETTFSGYRDKDRKATAGFETHFQNFNQKAPSREVYSANAKISGRDVGNQRKYQPGATTKNQIVPGGAGPLQVGVRWSKAALDLVRSEAVGKIHFHLDGMGDIEKIIKKEGDFSHNVTSRELRYVYKNWDKEFKDHVLFYNGYTNTDSVVQVVCPWLFVI